MTEEYKKAFKSQLSKEWDQTLSRYKKFIGKAATKENEKILFLAFIRQKLDLPQIKGTFQNMRRK